MRGYEILRKSQSLDLLINIKEELTNLPLEQPKKYSCKLIFGAGYPKAELITRQYLITRLMGIDFNKQVLIALCHRDRKLVYPIPKEWRIVIEKYGLRTLNLENRLYWFGYKLFFILFGLFNVASMLYHSITGLFQKDLRDFTDTAYFHALSKHNLPNPNGISQDIVSWYLSWPGKIKNLKSIWHTVRDSNVSLVSDIPIYHIQSPNTKLKSIIEFVNYFTWSIRAFFICMKDLFSSGFFNSIMFGEGANAASFNYGKLNGVNRDYLFHNSGWIYRPLWTYEAEKLGARILFYFYSTNCESFKLPEGYTNQTNSWEVMNWPKYLVWDKFQSDFVKRAVGVDSDIEIVGPIWFTADNQEIPKLPLKNIAVFDIQPHRDSRYQLLGIEHEYYTPKTMNSFLEDIYFTANNFQYSVVLKRKRNIGKLLNGKYLNILNKLEKRPNFYSIDPDISAFSLIQQCSIVISIPFTSTAIIAREQGKITAYYDPIGIIQKDDRAAHGIEVISGKIELEDWMKKSIAELNN